jgi:hypothetical protein
MKVCKSIATFFPYFRRRNFSSLSRVEERDKAPPWETKGRYLTTLEHQLNPNGMQKQMQFNYENLCIKIKAEACMN